MKRVAVLLPAYLGLVVLANLTVAHFGPGSTLVVAVVLIGATLVVRDLLHDRWQGPQLALRMGAVICVGAVLSYVLNQGAARIALASGLAFLAAEAVDALVYQTRHAEPWLIRSNSSNVASALVDSAVFVLVAFGGPWSLVLAQWGVKVLGGMLWSALLQRGRA